MYATNIHNELFVYRALYLHWPILKALYRVILFYLLLDITYRCCTGSLRRWTTDGPLDHYIIYQRSLRLYSMLYVFLLGRHIWHGIAMVFLWNINHKELG